MRPSPRIVPARRRVLILLCVGACAAIVVATVPVLRQCLLRAAGHALVAQDPPARADVIVISTDSLGAGVLEADDLVRAGYATRVAIFDRPPTKSRLEFARRGVQGLDLNAATLQELNALGIAQVEIIPEVTGTEDEGKVLRRWCSAHSVRSLLFISSPDHSRRARRVLVRALTSQGVRVMVRSTPFSDFDADNWWQNRNGVRIEILESEKLLLDLVRHPFG